MPFWTFGLRDLKLEIQRKPQEEEEESKKAIHTFISVLCGAESVPSLDLLQFLSDLGLFGGVGTPKMFSLKRSTFCGFCAFFCGDFWTE